MSIPVARSRQQSSPRPGGVKSARDELLTVAEVLSELNIARATFYGWRQLGRAPQAIKLPNGQLRIRRSALDRWLDSLTEDDMAALADDLA